MALSAEGYAVRTMRDAPDRVLRLAALGDVDLVIVDTASSAATLRETFAARRARVGVIQVQAEGARGVTKFGPLAALVAEVDITCSNLSGRGRLRVVS